jgi:hypothetical protein
MSSIVSKLISILLMSDMKRERKLFPAEVKYQILVAQKNKCAMCKGHMEKLDREFDHKNGDCSNNKISNCQPMAGNNSRK